MYEQLINVLTDPVELGIAFGAMAMGILLGALPGLTGPMAMALLLGVAYTMTPEHSVTAMMLIYMGGAYGGSMSAILLNVPGAPASAATALDGHPLAKQGLAGRTIGMVTISSFFGSLIAVGMMAWLTPWLVKVSLLFTAWELLLLVTLGVLIAGSLSSDDPLKGWMAGCFGLLIAQIGLDDIHMHPRFSFGSSYLEAGIGLIAAIVGLFGLSQVMLTMRPLASGAVAVAKQVKGIIPPLSELRGRMRLVLQSGIIGTFIGVLPGLGADMGAWVSYDMAKRTSKKPELFGKGSMEGVIAAETGNNAVVPGALIPVIALGLPGSAGAAIIMAGLFLHGLKPGPTFLMDNYGLFEYMVAALFVGSFMLLVAGLIIGRGIVHVLRVPRENIMAVVIALAAMGSYASKLQFNDLWMMIGFGLLAYGMRRLGYPLAPLVLGIVLGRLLDEYLRQALMISDGSLMPLVERPICLGLMAVLSLFVIVNVRPIRRVLGRIFLPSQA
ncbi:MAG: tripartite tricarboxylate transporter permease [Ectothiorhodospiraceae bacterium]|nr:tripartite tricarboxylate transporter permease [Chromatiales bacterium]MCP5156407.1 tripartite tricarboxylate transporter permease [Ectothiorhodospiraceae bacterium]